jgi:predicted DNA-binding transcriptional regulator YafY
MRASRLLAILILLQLRGRQTAEALAAEFEVSVRTIYRDIDSLSAAGIPVYGDRGHGGGFELLDGYRTRLTGLNADEAEAMLMIGLPQQAEAMGLGAAAERARSKLMAALPASGSEDANRVARRIHLDMDNWYRAARPVPFLTQVARAALDQQTVSLQYQSWRSLRCWEVQPYGLVLKQGNWYLVGCTNGSLRTFNIADVKQLVVLDKSFELPDGFVLARWWHESLQAFESRLRPGKAILRASVVGLQRLRLLGDFAELAVAHADAPDADGWCRLELPLEEIESAAPMLLGIGPEITILEPVELRDAVADLARRIVARIDAQGSN